MNKTLALIAVFAAASIGFGASAHAASISTQMGIGSTGASVTALQTLLASNSLIYPAGMISGYYGPMTAAAVQQFQIANNLSPVGNVGPQTFAKLNKLMANGVTVLDVSAPQLSAPQVTMSGTSATIRWNTGEMAFGKIHYDINPISMFESTVSMQEPSTSGTIVAEVGENTSHAVQLNNLNHGQTYYFSTESEDPTGNLSVTLPSSFYLP